MRFARPELVVVKIGSSSLRGSDGRLDLDRVADIAAQIATVRAAGTQVVLVSSGAVSAGMGLLGLDRRPTDLPTLQACAAAGQGELMHAWQRELAGHRLTGAQILLTQDDFVRRGHYLNARTTLRRLLELGAVPVINENDAVATEELAYGDNDRLAALVSGMVDAGLLLMLSDVDGLYDGDPRGQSGAAVIERIDDPTQTQSLTIGGTGSFVGSGGMRTKVAAATVAVASAADAVVANAATPGVVASAVSGENVGTWFVAGARRPDARRLWIAFALSPHGTIVVDHGAVRALRDGGRSLLSVGVVHVTGSFLAGDPVEVQDPDGTPIARGLVGLDATDVSKIVGMTTAAAAAAHGDRFARAVIHRDDLVVLT